MIGPTKPYPGLRPFEREEDSIFFGREEQTDQILRKLGETHFVAVLGTSGSGKSSLVRAGVLPALEGGFLADAGARLEIATLRPGDRPIQRLAETLVRDTAWGREQGEAGPPATRGGIPAESATAAVRLAADLRKGPMALNWLLGVRPLPVGTRLLILVDQLEELFRYGRDAGGEADAFVALLLAAAGHPSVYVVVTMRSDFLGDCSRHPGLPEAVNAGLYLTPRLDSEQMADAIRLPARVFGGEVEPALVRRLLEEAGGETDQLPLLQHALMRLWELGAGPKRLALGDFKRLGGLRQALNDHAEAAYGELDASGQAIAEALFRGLVETGGEGRDTRRAARLADIAAIAEVPTDAVVAVVDAFRRQGRSFLMPPPGEPLRRETLVDITHEALIRQWGRLRAWAVAEGDRAELYRRLEGDARRRRATTGKGSLWSGYELALAVPWLEDRERTGRWALRYAAGGGSLDLALAFLQESAKAEETDRQAEEEKRRENQRQAIARVAHTIGTRIAVIDGTATRLRDALYEGSGLQGRITVRPEVSSLFERLSKGISKAQTVLADFRRFSSLLDLQTRELDLVDLLEAVRREQQDSIGCPILIRCGYKPLMVFGDASKLTDAFAELMDNAWQAIGEETVMSPQIVINVDLKETCADNKPSASIEFTNSGKGIPRERKQLIFDPYFSTKSGSSGLGLAIVREIIEKHRGTIEECGIPGKGANFTVCLPYVERIDSRGEDNGQNTCHRR